MSSGESCVGEMQSQLRTQLRKDRFIGLKFDIVGGSYQPAANRKRYVKMVTGEKLYLIRDPKNRHDFNAFAVCLSRQLSTIIGFMPRTLTEKVTPIFDKAAATATTLLEQNDWFKMHPDVKVSYAVEVTLDKGEHGFYDTVCVTDVFIHLDTK